MHKLLCPFKVTYLLRMHQCTVWKEGKMWL